MAYNSLKFIRIRWNCHDEVRSIFPYVPYRYTAIYPNFHLHFLSFTNDSTHPHRDFFWEENLWGGRNSTKNV